MINFLTLLKQQSKEAQYPDGMESAIIGMGTRKGTLCFVISRQKCIDILMKDQGMTDFEASEWMDFNVEGAYVGEDTPYFVDEEWGGV